MPARLPLLVAVALAGAAACDRHVYLGRLADGGTSAGILWQATFEPGDLSEWLSDGNGGVYTDGQAPDPVATRDQVHRGQYAGVAVFSPTSGTAFSYFYREQPSPAQAYYGAWLRLPASLQVRSFLSLLHFGYHPTAGDPNTTAIWDFDLQPDTDGSLVPRLYQTGAASPVTPQPAVPVPPATWVHFELLFKKAADATGQIVAWQDGVQIMDVANVVTAPTDWIQWDVGGGSLDVITPTPLSIYIDDVTISSTRVGPQP